MKRINYFFLINSTLCILHCALIKAQAPSIKMWDHTYGGDTTELLSAFITTSDGGFMLGGFSFSGTSGDKSQPTKGGYDYWVVKLDSLGQLEWERDYGGNDFERLNAICETRDGGYLLGGFSNSGISGDKTQPCLGVFDYWIVRIDSVGTVLWDKNFGGTNDDELFSARQTSDGGFILGGFSSSGIGGDKTQPTWGDFDFWLIKTDSSGNKIWDVDIGGTDVDVLFDICQTNDEGYIMSGFSISGIGGNKTYACFGVKDYWVVKTDSLGLVQWDKVYGGANEDAGFSVIQTVDGGYAIGGTSASGISGNKTQSSWNNSSDYWLMKTDSLGTPQWDKVYGGFDNEDEFGLLKQSSDGSFLLSGSSYSQATGNKSEANLGVEQMWVLKTDSAGNISWNKTIQTSGHDENGFMVQAGACIVAATSGNGNIGGYKSEDSRGHYDYWIVKLCDSIAALPIANVAAIPDLCPGTCVNFLNLSANATSYQWFFLGGNPSSSSAANPSNICYSNPGQYHVTLIASNSIGADTLQLPNFITVYPQPPPQGITQSGDTLFAIQGATSYQWYFNGTLISGASDYFYVAMQSGDYNVVATDENGCEVEAVIFNVIAAVPSTPDSYRDDRGPLTVFPNPVSDELIIKNEVPIAIGIRIGTARISIYNVVGQLAVQPQTVNFKLQTRIDVSELISGIYIIEIKTGNNIYRAKFVKV